MSNFPDVPKLQVLSCLVDTASTHDLATLHGIFDPYAELVNADSWHEVLLYTYALLTAIEAELMLLAKRLHQLGSWLRKDPQLLQDIDNVRPAFRPAEVAQGQGEDQTETVTDHDGPRLKDLVVHGVSILRRRSEQRLWAQRNVTAWAQQAKDMNVV